MVTPLIKPTTIVEPFANTGTKNTIPVTASATPGRASLDTGFPPLTFTPVQSGGVPPSGGDFNGILNWITQHSAWLNAGGQYTFDATLATFIGGYPVGMVLQSNDGFSSYVNVSANNSTDFNTTPAAIGVSWLPFGGAAVSGSGATSVALTGGSSTLTNLQASRRIIIVTGVLTSNQTLVFPNLTQPWTVLNKTTGAFTLTCKPASGSGVVVQQGKADTIIYDGTNVVFTLSDTVTQTAGDSTASVASTAFVATAIINALVNTALTGIPTAPNQTAGSNNTRVANCAYVDAAIATFGVASVPQYKSSAFSASGTGDYWTDTRAAGFTMTLPDPPIGANLIRVQDIAGLWAINPLTIDPGTRTILGAAGTLTCDISGETIELWYDTTGTTWRIA